MREVRNLRTEKAANNWFGQWVAIRQIVPLLASDNGQPMGRRRRSQSSLDAQWNDFEYVRIKNSQVGTK